MSGYSGSGDSRPGRLSPPRRLGGLGFALEQPFPRRSIDSCLALYMTWEYWIQRKIYRFSLIDIETISHQIRLEMQLPGGLPTLPESDRFLVPMGVFRRGLALMNVSLIDDAGDEVPLLTASENDAVVDQMLASATESNSRPAIELLNREVVKFSGFIQEGSTGRCVAKVQQLLREQGLLALEPTGRFGKLTGIAVTRYQEKEGLRVDGVVGQQTAAMLGENRESPGGMLTEEQCRWLSKPDPGYLQIAMMSDPSQLRRSLTLEYETRLEPLRDTVTDPYVRDAHESFFSPAVRDGYEPRPYRMDSSKLAITWPISGLADAERSRIECEVPQELEIDEAMGFWLSPVGKMTTGEEDGPREGAGSPTEVCGDEIRAGILEMDGPSETPTNGTDPPDGASAVTDEPQWESDRPLARMRRQHTSSRAYFLPGRVGSKVPVLGRRDGFANLGQIVNEQRPEPTWRDQPAFVTVLLRPRWEDLRDSFLALGIASVILLLAAAGALIGTVFAEQEAQEKWLLKTPLATVVAFTASIATSILIRPDSHEMAGFLLKPVRIKLALLGLIPVLAAVTITFPIEPWKNGVILVVIAMVELAYTAYCWWVLRTPTSAGEDEVPREAAVDASREYGPTGKKAVDLLTNTRIWIVRDAEMFRDYDFDIGQTEEADPITSRGLAKAAHEFADSAGWNLEEI